MKYNYKPANFKDLKEAIQYIMYTGSVFFRGEEINFQLLEGIQKPFGVGGKTVVEALELRQLKNILGMLTIREEVSETQLWKDQLKEGGILCNHKDNFHILIIDVVDERFGLSARGFKHKLSNLTPVSKDEMILVNENFIEELKNVRETILP